MKLLATLAISLSASICFAQNILATSLARTSSDPTAIQAFAAAAAPLRYLTGKDLQVSNATMSLKESGKHRRYWMIRIGSFTTEIYCDSLKLRYFANSARVEDQFRRRERTGQRKFNSQQQMRDHLRLVANALGVPSSSTLGRMTVRDDKDSKDNSANGFFAAHFRNANGKIVATINCDIQDGTVVNYYGY